MARWSFTEHPRQVGETYLQHMRVASGFGTRMVLAGLACLLHALFPFLFTTTGSRTVAELHARMAARHVPRPGAASQQAGYALVVLMCLAQMIVHAGLHRICGPAAAIPQPVVADERRGGSRQWRSVLWLC